MSSLKFLATILAFVVLPLATAKHCPPLGPVLPAPRSPSQHAAVGAATSSLRAALDAQIRTQINASAISIAVKSIHEDALLFNYHFTPPTLSGLGTTTIDENTIYRVGSISKLMPVLALLQNSNVSMEDPVTKYIPQLRDAMGESSLSSVPWDDVTVGALASHLAGLGTDSAMDLALFPTGPWTVMGLPEVVPGSGPSCSGLPGTKPCTGDDLIRDMARRLPVYLPYTTPVYSNIGFALLGMVVQAATNRSFGDAVQSQIFDVVGMSSSSFDGFPPSFSQRGFIPVRESTWNATLGVYEAAGGMFSSTNDLIAFAEALLEHRLLSARKTRQWLQPNAHTTTMSFSVGSPWEIMRTDTLTADGRTIDVYTKSGDLGLYHGLLGLVPDYDIVISVLTGGLEVTAESAMRTILFSAVAESLLPALEQSGRDETIAAGYTGTYQDEATNSTLKLRADSGPGLVVDAWTVRGFDVLGNFSAYSLGALETGRSGSAPASRPQGRLYPSNRRSNNQTAWRAVVDTATVEQKAALDERIFYKDGSCVTWFGMDRSAYNFLSLQDFVVVTGGDGHVQAIKNPAFNVTFIKVSSDAGAGIPSAAVALGVKVNSRIVLTGMLLLVGMNSGLLG